MPIEELGFKTAAFECVLEDEEAEHVTNVFYIIEDDGVLLDGGSERGCIQLTKKDALKLADFIYRSTLS